MREKDYHDFRRHKKEKSSKICKLYFIHLRFSGQCSRDHLLDVGLGSEVADC